MNINHHLKLKLDYFNLLDHEGKDFIFVNEDKICLVKQDMEMKHNLNQDGKVIAHCWCLEKVYLLLLKSDFQVEVYVYDLKERRRCTVLLFYTQEILFPVDSSCSFIDSKILLIGGINKFNKISNEILSFDIGTYTFSNEKVRENNMTPRYQHGSIIISSVIYLVGGYTTNKNFCNTIQFLRYDNLMSGWGELKIKNAQPEKLVTPQLHFLLNKYLLAFSYCEFWKVWVLNSKTNEGTMIRLDEVYPYRSIVTYKEEDEFDFNHMEGKRVVSKGIKINYYK